MAALDPAFDPLPPLLEVRRSNNKSNLAISTFTAIQSRRLFGDYLDGSIEQARAELPRRKHELSIANLPENLRLSWDRIQGFVRESNALWVLDECKRFDVPIQDFVLAYQRSAPKDANVKRVLGQLMVARLKDRQPIEWSTRLLNRRNPFALSHVFLDHESDNQIDIEFSLVRGKVEDFGPRPTRLKALLRRLARCSDERSNAEIWWRDYLSMQARNKKYDSSKVAVLLAYELRARGLTVHQLYEAMRKHRTENPQAALFLFDR